MSQLFKASSKAAAGRGAQYINTSRARVYGSMSPQKIGESSTLVVVAFLLLAAAPSARGGVPLGISLWLGSSDGHDKMHGRRASRACCVV